MINLEIGCDINDDYLTRVFANEQCFVILLDVLPDAEDQPVLKVGNFFKRDQLARQVRAFGQSEVCVAARPSDWAVNHVRLAAFTSELEKIRR